MGMSAEWAGDCVPAGAEHSGRIRRRLARGRQRAALAFVDRNNAGGVLGYILVRGRSEILESAGEGIAVEGIRGAAAENHQPRKSDAGYKAWIAGRRNRHGLFLCGR